MVGDYRIECVCIIRHRRRVVDFLNFKVNVQFAVLYVLVFSHCKYKINFFSLNSDSMCFGANGLPALLKD